VPLYEYECVSCHHRFEKIESYSAPEKRKCPKCGKVAGRVLTAPAIQFKGSGWYVTDYGGKSASGAAKNGGTPKAEGNSGDGNSKKSTSEKTGTTKTSTDKKA
jgi:putative FmdB family regulatory protein